MIYYIFKYKYRYYLLLIFINALLIYFAKIGFKNHANCKNMIVKKTINRNYIFLIFFSDINLMQIMLGRIFGMLIPVCKKWMVSLEV